MINLTKQKKKEKTEPFNIGEELEKLYKQNTNYLVEGFELFIQDKKVSTKKEYDEYLKSYGGLKFD